jgi:flagellar assembly factor FliW
MVNAKEQSIRNLIQQKRDSLLSFAPIAVSPSAVEVSVPEAAATESIAAATESIAAAVATAAESTATAAATATTAAHIVVNSNDVEAIQAFLEQRKKEAE